MTPSTLSDILTTVRAAFVAADALQAKSQQYLGTVLSLGSVGSAVIPPTVNISISSCRYLRGQNATVILAVDIYLPLLDPEWAEGIALDMAEEAVSVLYSVPLRVVSVSIGGVELRDDIWCVPFSVTINF